MNGLDRAIAALSPGWGARRAYFRHVLSTAEGLQTRKYEAARGDRRTDGWYAPATGPNAELWGAAQRIRDRGRDLVRNNPIAAGVPRKLAAKIVGSGIFPRSTAPEIGQRRAVKDIWNRFAENSDSEGLTDHYGQQHVGARTFVEAGEYLVRYSIAPSRPKTDFPLRATVLEPDFLDANKTEPLPDGGMIIQGIQFDPYGRRVGYWLYNEHPGETMRVFTRRAAISNFVPADEVDHVFDQLRPGQARGVSMFAASTMIFRDIEDLRDAEMMRRKAASCFAAFVSRPANSATAPMLQSKTDDTGRRIENLSPGMIKYLEAGEEIEFGSPPTVETLADILRHDLRAAAAGVGITYEMMTGDLTGVNFSSIRIGINDFLDLLDHWQWHSIVPMQQRRVWQRVGRVAAIIGLRKLDDPWQASWIMPKRRYASPKDDVAAKKDEVRAMLESPFDAMAENGSDPDDIILDVAAFNAQIDKDKIITDLDPRRVGRTSTPAAALPTEGQRE